MILWLMLFRAHTKCSVPSLRVILMGNYYKNLTSGKYCTPVLEPCWQVCSLATRKIFFTKCWTYGYPGFLMVDSPFFIHTAKREKSPSMPSEKVYSFS